MVAVSSNFLKTTTKEFLQVKSRVDELSDLDIIEDLYTVRGSQSMIISQETYEFLDAGMSPGDSLMLVLYNGTYSSYHELRVSSVCKVAPVFRFNMRGRPHSLVVSLPTYMRLTGGRIKNYYDIPMRQLLLKTKDNSEQTLDYVFNKLNSWINANGLYISIWDYRDYKDSIDSSKSLINIIFTAVSSITMALCFFSLISSMTANILEQTKEISVLRAIGLTQWQMIRLYIYEAFTLVFSSSIMGMFLGILVGYTMILQRTLFTNLPIPFEFPTMIFIAILMASIACAVISTFLPARQIVKYPIAEIIRMTG